jgi:tRNA (cmo5U34)-methyltransferase
MEGDRQNLMSADDKVEEMAAFFDARAAGYDTYMRDSIFPDAAFTQFYQAMSSPIERTDEPLRILDLGCGTGLELETLFQRVPNAVVTGIDLAGGMLDLLRQRYVARASQITLIADSYLTLPFEQQAYDHIIAALSLHHILHDTKRELYAKLHAALKPGGKYVEGDSVVPADMESQFLDEYYEEAATVPPAPDGHYHIDVPFSIATQRSLLSEAGFRDFGLVWQKDSTAVWNIAVYVVTK